MNKINYFLISMSLMCSSFVFADSAYYDPTKMSTLKALGKSFYQSQWHKCHLNTVYYVEVGNISYSSMVWNHTTSSPLKCTEYESYIELTRKKFPSTSSVNPVGQPNENHDLSKDEVLAERTGTTVKQIEEDRLRRIKSGLLFVPDVESN